jgi:ubiquinone/menaquinone biosynthesis C-methylase UbiE
VAADVRALPYRDGSVAGYVSIGVIEHFQSETRQIILQEAARVLRPGGRGGREHAALRRPAPRAGRRRWVRRG